MKKDTKVSKVAKMQIREERTHGRRAVARKGAKGKRKAVWEKTERVFAAWCRKGGTNILYASDEDDSENIDDTLDNDEELQAWCLLEECENGQWQEMISRRDTQKVKKANRASLLSVTLQIRTQ